MSNCLSLFLKWDSPATSTFSASSSHPRPNIAENDLLFLPHGHHTLYTLPSALSTSFGGHNECTPFFQGDCVLLEGRNCIPIGDSNIEQNIMLKKKNYEEWDNSLCFNVEWSPRCIVKYIPTDYLWRYCGNPDAQITREGSWVAETQRQEEAFPQLPFALFEFEPYICATKSKNRTNILFKNKI